MAIAIEWDRIRSFSSRTVDSAHFKSMIFAFFDFPIFWMPSWVSGCVLPGEMENLVEKIAVLNL